jgi:hypothetical protein
LGAGTSTVNVFSTIVPTNIFNHGNATVTVSNGPAGVANIKSPLNLENLGGFDTLIVDDSADTTSPSVTLDTLAGNVGRISGLSAPITFSNAEVSQLTLDLGIGIKTVSVLGIGTTTNIFNSADATIEVGNGSLAGIQGALSLDNDGGIDQLFIDDFNDQQGQVFTFNRIPGDDFFNTFEQITSGVFGRAGSITFDNADVSSMVFTAGNGGNLFNVNSTGTATTINGGTGGNTFEVGSGNLGSDIQGQLVLHGGGNPLTAMSLLDQNNPNIETYNFNFFLPGSADLSLGSNLQFDLVFTDMLNFVDLSTNGNPLDTVIAPPGTVNVF